MLELYFDGGNEAGIAVYGVTGLVDGKTVVEVSGICHPSLEQTNNVAEWTALKNALMIAYLNRADYDKILIYGDSELVVKQLNGEYACKKPHLKDLYNTSLKIFHSLRVTNDVMVGWIPREKNVRADELGHEIRKRHLTGGR